FFIDLERIEPQVVFVPGEAVALDILSGNRRPGSSEPLVSADGTGQLQYSSFERQGLSYRVYMPQAGLIAKEREHPRDLQRYLQIPPNISPRIADLARNLAKDTTEPAELAITLERALRKNYQYDL